MIWLGMMLSAFAAPPRVVVSQPLEVETPVSWTLRADRPTLQRFSAWVLRAPAEDLQLRAVASPVWYAGPWPARPVLVSGDCAVMVTPEVDLTLEPVFLGPETLPERVDASRGAAARPVGARPAGGERLPEAKVADEAALYAAAAQLAAGWCQAP